MQPTTYAVAANMLLICRDGFAKVNSIVCVQDADGGHGRRRQAVDNNLIKDQIRKQLHAPDGDGGLISDSEDEDDLARFCS